MQGPIDINQLIQQSMQAGGGNPAKGPTGPAVQPRNPEEGGEIAPDAEVGVGEDGGIMGPDITGHPDYIRAKAEWMIQNGREPATDAELMEVEQLAQRGQQPDPKQMILQKMMGGGQGGY